MSWADRFEYEVAMAISIDAALGPLTNALSLRARRSEVLASNLANADTPHFKARDFDFQAALATAQGEQAGLRTTHAKHIAFDSQTSVQGASLQYRVPQQASLDGNTVDNQVEQAAFTENAVQYQATLTFLSGRIKGLLTAIKGE